MQVIGPKLKKARVQLSLTLDEISERTRIHRTNLERLEKGEWGFLPDVYLRGMVQQFADIVGVDIREFLEKQAAQAATGATASQISEPLESAPTIANNPLENLKNKTVSRYAPYIGAAGLICIITLLLIFKNFSPSSDSAEIQPISVTQAHNDMKQLKTNEPPLEPQLLTLSLKATGETWLKVAADDSLPYEYVLRTGQIKNWHAHHSFNLRIGNPGAVEFRLNNLLLPFSGNPNQVTTLLITEKGMSIQ